MKTIKKSKFRHRINKDVVNELKKFTGAKFAMEVIDVWAIHFDNLTIMADEFELYKTAVNLYQGGKFVAVINRVDNETD